MVSAYSVAQGKEPEFTNFSKIREQPVFMETLDYIFLSKHWKVLSVTELISKTAIIAATAGRPLPDKEYPSDHLLIATELSL
jgi:2',5'-phosphodiesterase